jgi:hypothetical protein
VCYVVKEICTDLKAFEMSYSLESSDLTPFVRGAIVILGLSDICSVNLSKRRFQQTFLRSGYDVKDEKKSQYWHVVKYVHRHMDRIVCFFEWIPSFLGEVFEMLGLYLLKLGAIELLHIGCKIGILKVFDDKQDEKIFERKDDVMIPDAYTIASSVDAQYNVKLTNSLTLEGISTNAHCSVICPFEEDYHLVWNLLRSKGVLSFDCEGAYFARAVEKFNKNPAQYQGPKTHAQFGAIYFVSDVLDPIQNLTKSPK